MRYRFAWWWGAAAVLAMPAMAQEEPQVPPMDIEIAIVLDEDDSDDYPISTEVEDDSAQPESEPSSRLVAAVWCPLLSERRGEQTADQSTDGEGGEQSQNGEQVEEPQCDAGMGFALFVWHLKQGSLSLVGVVGTRSLGPGIGWTFARYDSHPLSVAIGVVVPYDSGGVYYSEWALAVGATVSVFGRQ